MDPTQLEPKKEQPRQVLAIFRSGCNRKPALRLRMEILYMRLPGEMEVEEITDIADVHFYDSLVPELTHAARWFKGPTEFPRRQDVVTARSCHGVRIEYVLSSSAHSRHHLSPYLLEGIVEPIEDLIHMHHIEEVDFLAEADAHGFFGEEAKAISRKGIRDLERSERRRLSRGLDPDAVRTFDNVLEMIPSPPQVADYGERVIRRVA